MMVLRLVDVMRLSLMRYLDYDAVSVPRSMIDLQCSDQRHPIECHDGCCLSACWLLIIIELSYLIMMLSKRRIFDLSIDDRRGDVVFYPISRGLTIRGSWETPIFKKVHYREWGRRPCLGGDPITEGWG